MANVSNMRVVVQGEPDPLFAVIRRDAEEAMRREPELGYFMTASVLNHATLEQAVARSGGEAGTHGKDQPGSRVGNKGIECAEAALEMVDLMSRLPL